MRAINRFYLTENNKNDIRNARSFYELVVIADDVLTHMKQPIIQVCGPISTGGKGSVKENMLFMAEVINELTNRGLNVFNQLPFERAFDRIMRTYKISGYDTPILEEFYGPIFESGKIKEIYLLPGWEKSIGARWEHNYAKKMGIKIKYYM